MNTPTAEIQSDDVVWVDGSFGEYPAIFIAWDGTAIHADGSEHRIARIYREQSLLGAEYTVEEWQLRKPR